MKLKKFKIRAHAAGKIMGGSVGLTDAQQRTFDELIGKDKLTAKQEQTLIDLHDKIKNPSLPSGAKTYCDVWIKEQIYGRKKEFASKYTDKGLIMEDNSLDFAAEFLNLGFLVKNEEKFEDSYCEGTPDAIPAHIDDLVIDIKNSWDAFTFPLLEDSIDSDYFYQGQVYMGLTGRKKYKLIYTLMDTPHHLIEREAYWYCKNNGIDDTDGEILQMFIDKMTYSDIEDKYKIKVYNFEFDQKVYDEIMFRVELCRKYIESKMQML